MALSQRFGQIQHVVGREEEDTSEEYFLLLKLIGKNSLLEPPSSLPNTAARGDVTEKEASEDDDEQINPMWKLEFQTIMNKCKLRQVITANQAHNRNKQRTNFEPKKLFNSAVLQDRKLDCIVNKKETKTDGDDISNNEIKAFQKQANTKMQDFNAEKKQINQSKGSALVDNAESTDIVSNLDAEMTKVGHDVLPTKELKYSSEGSLHFNQEMNNYNIDEYTSHSRLTVNEQEMGTTKNVNFLEVNDTVVKQSENQHYVQSSHKEISIENKHDKKIPRKQDTRHVLSFPKLEASSKMHGEDSKSFTKKTMQNSNVSSAAENKSQNHPVSKERTERGTSKLSDKSKKVKCPKKITVTPANSFPLDELLPQEPPKQPSKSECQTIPVKRLTVPSKIQLHTDSYQDSVFHGEVYNSPFSDDAQVKDSDRIFASASNTDKVAFCPNSESSLDPSDSVNKTLPNAVKPPSCMSLEQFPLIKDAIHEGNLSFMEHLRNALSQQVGSNQQKEIEEDDQFTEEVSMPENSKMGYTCKGGFGFYNELKSSAKCKDNELHKENDKHIGKDNNSSKTISEKGDNLDNQSGELFQLFIQQCSQLVKTDEDKSMLSSLVDLLRKESGNELCMSDFTPTTPVYKNEQRKDRHTESCKSGGDAKVELFEGRTLLKGGVQPRHIPKTTLIKSGKDKPVDPRPVSIMLAKTVPKSIPLPKFVYDLWDKSVIQRILTLDWDCKRVHYLNEHEDLNKETEIPHLYNPSKHLGKNSSSSPVAKSIGTDLKVCLAKNKAKARQELFPVNSADSTPVKDELCELVHVNPTVSPFLNVSPEQNHNVSGKGKVARTLNLTEENESALFEHFPLSDHSTPVKDEKIISSFQSPQDDTEIGKDETAVTCNFDIESVCKTSSFLDTFDANEMVTSLSIMNKYTETDLETKKEWDAGVKALDLTVMKQYKQAELKNCDLFAKDNKENKHTYLESRTIPIHISSSNRKISYWPTAENQAINENVIVLKESEDSTKETAEAKLRNYSDCIKQTRPRVGVVKPMPVIVISDEDENEKNLDDGKTTPDEKKNKKNKPHKIASSDKFAIVNIVEKSKTLKHKHKQTRDETKRKKSSPSEKGKTSLCEQVKTSKHIETSKQKTDLISKNIRTAASSKKVAPDKDKKPKAIKRSSESEKRKKSPSFKNADKNGKDKTYQNANKLTNENKLQLKAGVCGKEFVGEKSHNLIDRYDFVTSENPSQLRKRKHVSAVVSQDLSDLEDGQIISDCGSDLDGKRKKREDKPENLQRACLIRSQHYRERKRHSSCSSIESVHDDEHTKKYDMHQKPRVSSNSSASSLTRLSNTKQTDAYKSKTESHKNSRKRHHTVHDNSQPSSEKKSRMEPSKSLKRRHSDNSDMLVKSSKVQMNHTTGSTFYDDILSPDDNHSSSPSKCKYYDDILSPEYPSLSDEQLSEEYRRFFGKSIKNADHIQPKVAQREPVTEVPHKQSKNKTLQEDQAFLEQYKLKVQKKDTVRLMQEIKTEKTIDIKQELEDRKFLENCKKKLEEKAKLSVKERLKTVKIEPW